MNAAFFGNRKPRIARIDADPRIQKSALIREIRDQSSGNGTNVAAEETDDAEYADDLADSTIKCSASSAFSAVIMSRNN